VREGGLERGQLYVGNRLLDRAKQDAFLVADMVIQQLAQLADLVKGQVSK
jgi:hypothetical protein